MTDFSSESNSDLDILFQDHHFIAVCKPARIPIGSEDSGDVTLLQMVRDWNVKRQAEGKKGYCVPIHFLDRPVSGVVVFALSSKAATRLNEAFRDRKLSKVYLAVTESRPARDNGVLEDWLLKDKSTNVTSVSDKRNSEAKLCKLEYRWLTQVGENSLLVVKPVTGRSHQIRVQLSNIGCPIFGDLKYGAKKGWNGRIALHAQKLELEHPVTKIQMGIRAELPGYWFETFPKLANAEIP